MIEGFVPLWMVVCWPLLFAVPLRVQLFMQPCIKHEQKDDDDDDAGVTNIAQSLPLPYPAPPSRKVDTKRVVVANGNRYFDANVACCFCVLRNKATDATCSMLSVRTSILICCKPASRSFSAGARSFHRRWQQQRTYLFFWLCFQYQNTRSYYENQHAVAFSQQRFGKQVWQGRKMMHF